MRMRAFMSFLPVVNEVGLVCGLLVQRPSAKPAAMLETSAEIVTSAMSARAFTSSSSPW
jgi:hypothetical protein